MPFHPDRMDRFRGVLMGQAIGDALGLATEFMSRKQIARAYPRGIADYTDIVRDEHRGRWLVGAWTDDTDQLLCILDSLLAQQRVDLVDIARRLNAWADAGGMGIGRTVQRAMDRRGFRDDPVSAARQAWCDSRAKAAANGGVMRTSVLGLWQWQRADDVMLNAAQVCRVTHYDPRCVASCVVVCLAIRQLVFDPPDDVRAMVERLRTLALTFDPRCAEAFDPALDGSLAGLALDEGIDPDDPRRNRIGYTLKALGAGLWALLHAASFERGLLSVIYEGGDADSNAAVVGALLGAKFGASGIPPRWIEGLYKRDALEARIQALAERVAVA